MVGMTEAQARESGRDVAVGISDLGARGWLNGVEGLIKTVVDRKTDTVLGATSVGPVAGETVAALQVAMRGGVTTRELRRTIWAYPAFARAIPDALPDEAG
jgi:pyruvate/2-oxoglutarate dehydrogenase complex dihydrolipoamide dehydrogenase (E3) component